MGTISAAAANPAHRDLEMGRADSALQSLNASLSAHPGDAEAHNLRCRVYYQEQAWDPAIADCEAAVRLAPKNSNFHLWLGRAYGKKAEHASLMSAYALARRVRAEFDEAVQLDPRNVDALADLGEFDVDAPLVVGGGYARATDVVQQLRAVDPAAALHLQALIAEAKKDYGTAEASLRAAIAQSHDPAGAWMDLAAFYRRRGRVDDMLTAAHQGAAADHRHGLALVDGASNLTQSGREPQTAIAWLRQYLSSDAQSELAPAFVVRAQLATLLARQGDTTAAQEQIALVHSLASGYRIPSGNAFMGVAGL
ncbi:MAG: tetratricopeptide repeat protein [Acidobacteriota bacterium]